MTEELGLAGDVLKPAVAALVMGLRLCPGRHRPSESVFLECGNHSPLHIRGVYCHWAVWRRVLERCAGEPELAAEGLGNGRLRRTEFYAVVCDWLAAGRLDLGGPRLGIVSTVRREHARCISCRRQRTLWGSSTLCLAVVVAVFSLAPGLAFGEPLSFPPRQQYPGILSSMPRGFSPQVSLIVDLSRAGVGGIRQRWTARSLLDLSLEIEPSLIVWLGRRNILCLLPGAAWAQCLTRYWRHPSILQY